jgi:transcriptional regulator with XRE-family HTH domain
MENLELSKRVKEQRSKKGLSQEQLADLTGLSLRTIQRVENGETIPRGETLKRLAIALHISPDELIDWQVIDDKNVLIMLNLSQFGYLIFPLLGIIIVLTIWIIKKDIVKSVDELGKTILNFQFTLIIAYVLLSIVGLFIVGPISLIFAAIVLYIFNAIMISLNTIKISKSKKLVYAPSIKILK